MWRRTLASMFLPRLAAGNVPAWLARPLHEAVRADPELGRKYDALRRMELDASPAARDRGLSKAQEELLETMLLGGSGAPALATTGEDRPRNRLALPGLAGALSATALIGFVVLSPGKTPDADNPDADNPDADNPDAHSPFGVGDLSARSARLASEPLGVKVTCIKNGPEDNDVKGEIVDTATAGARQTGDVLTCPHGGLLAFSTTNLGRETRHVFVVGVGPNGERRWYAPFDKSAAATAVPPGQVDVVLPTLADTSTMPADTSVSLHVLISDEPFDAASIERQLASSRSRGLPLHTLERLPLVDVPLQARIDVVTAPRAE